MPHPPFMPHQETGAAFLTERGFALLADVPGLGKTATVVKAADMSGVRRGLVFCPAVVRPHWEREFMRWTHTVRPAKAIDGRVREVPGDGMTIVSHAAASEPMSMAHLRAGAPYDLIVVDESHEMRQFDAARTRAMLSPDGGAWSWASRFWCLSGTPMVNSAADFWPLFYGPLRTGISWWDFCQKFAAEMKPDDGGFRPIGIKATAELARWLQPHMLRRTLESVGVHLPPLAINQVSLDVGAEAVTAAMSELENWTPDRLRQALDEKDELRDSAMARVRRALGTAKINETARRVHAIVAGGDGPVVVFFQHTDVRKALYSILHEKCGFSVSWIDGTVTRPQLVAAEEWFQAGKIDVLLVQTQAGGMGLTLTRAHRAVVAELPWTSVALLQAVKRVHRIGQTQVCTAEVLRASGCWLEDALANVVQRKQRASEELLSLLTARR